MNATEIKKSADLRLATCLLHTGEPEAVIDVLAMSDAQLQDYLETKLAAHRAQRGVVLA